MWTRALPILIAAMFLTACAAPSEAVAARSGSAPPLRWRAVFVAGDPSLPVWDNAARRFAERLQASGYGVPGAITRITARRSETASGAQLGGRAAALAAITALRPQRGEGCLVFLTMHGGPNSGLHFEPAHERLMPAELDAALSRGCGNAPTLVITSGCFTGIFARAPMARPNRIVMTAARPDRSSFGCGADFELTVFDGCLLQSLESGGPVAVVWQEATACVRAEEVRRRVTPPSEPVWHAGRIVRDLALPPLQPSS